MYEDESANALSEDGSLDQTVPSLGSPSHSSPSSQPGLEHIERFSRKVFVGGLPPDIDEGMRTVLFGYKCMRKQYTVGLSTGTRFFNFIENRLLTFDRYTKQNVYVSKQNIDPQSEKS